MAWDQLAVTKPHLVYIILGGFTSLFMLCSSVIKEKLYIGEATVATVCGIIFGPHGANLINPLEWGNADLITLEFSRIVLVVQCFAVGVELPRSYMEKHWKSVSLLLVPVMTFGWMVTSLFIWLLFPQLNWLDSLCCAACVTATDPVLASSVVGKGKFAKRVPRHLRDLLSAESGSNDGMAFPFVYLALYILHYRPDTSKVSYHWFCYTVLYECIFGAIYGFVVGYMARRAIRYAHEKDLIDRESFLVFYFVMALFCAGSGSILGLDDLLVGFTCGVGFSNDGWFQEKTEESHVSNVIDLLINLTFFVYFGALIPWNQYNLPAIGTSPWRLIVLGLLVLLFRRIPIMLALKPIIPDLKTWREALFAGHFGPIGVGAIFVAILVRADLETHSTIPTDGLPGPENKHLNIIEVIWPITTFLVMLSIIVHGSSIAVFTLGKRINTLTLTLSYTQANEDCPSWMDRLPRIQSRSKSSVSLNKMNENEAGDSKESSLPNISSAFNVPANFLRRQRDDETPSRASSIKPPGRRRNWDVELGPGGPISRSAIAPQSRRDAGPGVRDSEKRAADTPVSADDSSADSKLSKRPSPDSVVQEEEVYREGPDIIVEDHDGNVLSVSHDEKTAGKADDGSGHARKGEDSTADHRDSTTAVERPGARWKDVGRKFPTMRNLRPHMVHREPTRQSPDEKPRRVPAHAYQFGNTIIVEDENGEVLKKYDIPSAKRPQAKAGASYSEPSSTRQRLQRVGTYLGVGAPASEADTDSPVTLQTSGKGRDGGASASAGGDKTSRNSSGRSKGAGAGDDEDHRVRFTVTSGGRRMDKAEFIEQIKRLDPKSRAEVVEESDVSREVKERVKAEARQSDEDLGRLERDAANVGVQAQIQRLRLGRSRTRTLTQTQSRTDDPADLSPQASRTEAVPFHSVSQAVQTARRGRETAAERRRMLSQASATAGDGNSDNDNDEYGDGETAAERRRREGALGISKEDSDSVSSAGEADEEEAGQGRDQRPAARQAGAPAAPARPPGVRFADQHSSPLPHVRWSTSPGRAAQG